MKKSTTFLLPFAAGLIFMGFLHFSTRCERYGDDDPNDPGSELDIDYRSIKAIAKDVQEAFLTGKPEEVASIMLGEALAFNEEDLSGRTAEDLKAQGEAFKSRTLSAVSEGYAEYTYSYNGSEFTMTFCREDEGVWKLVRY
jgi:hypothetical protein